MIRVIRFNEEFAFTAKNKWNSDLKETIDSFLNDFDDLKEKLGDYNNNTDPVDILDDFIEVTKSSFEKYLASINRLNNSDDLKQSFNEISLSISYMKKEFVDKLKKLENNEIVIKIYERLLDDLRNFLFSDKIKNGADKIFYNKKSIDNIREDFKKYMKSELDSLSILQEKTNVKDIVLSTNLQTKEKELTFNAGDEIRYKKGDGEENTAFYSQNQEDLKEKDNVRLINKDGEKFEVKRENIIEIVKRSGDLTNQIKTDIKEIMPDKNKVKKLSDFLNKLKEE